MPPDPADLVNAILTAIPTDSRGLVVGCYDEDDRPHVHIEGRVVAIDQLGKVLRWLADRAINPAEPDDPWWTAGHLRELADQLDTQEAGRG